jgi:excisionase family DNA binding protein
MQRLFYSTGQVARQLGTTQAAVRTLCENRAIAAETSPGGHWRIPASEMERLKRDGLPPIPRPLPSPSAAPAVNGTSGGYDYPEFLEEPSDEVALAADRVAITKSTLEQRKVEREIEENEDWFRERKRRKAEAEVAERQRTEAKQAEQRRERWVQRWTEYAINSLPFDARGEAEMEVHNAVQEALSVLQPSESEAITWRLVDAAVHKALAPWTRKHDMERALKAGMNNLAWDVQLRAEYGPLKQRAWEAAVAAVGKVRAGASYHEMETAAVQAVQPMIREYEHQQACQQIVSRLYLFDLTLAEQDAAKEAVRKALAALPIDADSKQMEKTEAGALAPYKAALAMRKEKARLESEEQARRRLATSKADYQLGHIAKYLGEEYTIEGGDWAMLREVNRLRPLIREALIEELVENPDMSADEIRDSIEDLVDDELGR